MAFFNLNPELQAELNEALKKRRQKKVASVANCSKQLATEFPSLSACSDSTFPDENEKSSNVANVAGGKKSKNIDALQVKKITNDFKTPYCDLAIPATNLKTPATVATLLHFSEIDEKTVSNQPLNDKKKVAGDLLHSATVATFFDGTSKNPGAQRKRKRRSRRFSPAPAGWDPSMITVGGYRVIDGKKVKSNALPDTPTGQTSPGPTVGEAAEPVQQLPDGRTSADACQNEHVVHDDRDFVYYMTLKEWAEFCPNYPYKCTVEGCGDFLPGEWLFCTKANRTRGLSLQPEAASIPMHPGEAFCSRYFDGCFTCPDYQGNIVNFCAQWNKLPPSTKQKYVENLPF